MDCIVVLSEGDFFFELNCYGVYVENIIQRFVSMGFLSVNGEDFYGLFEAFATVGSV